VSLLRKEKQKTQRRVFRIRENQFSRGKKPRISVYRSLAHIYAQIIDDNAQKTLVSFSSLNLKKTKGDKKAIAKKVGLALGELAVEKSIKEVFFDRGKYKYHGRVRALAEGLREAGLNF
jgi:large subunit ribosomal protein L18